MTESRHGEFDHNIALKCVLLGISGVGKTSIVTRFVHNEYNQKTYPTIGAAFLSKIITGSYGIVKIELWDTAGQERYESLVPMYYRGAHIICIVYDITDCYSFDRAKKWVTELKDVNTPRSTFILIGNKCDRADERKVHTEEVTHYAEKNNILSYEVSAKMNININDIFESAVSQRINFIETVGTINDMNQQDTDLNKINLSHPSCTNTSTRISRCIRWIPFQNKFHNK